MEFLRLKEKEIYAVVFDNPRNRTATGYGAKLKTFLFQFKGEKVTRRAYARIYSNVGTVYFFHNGKEHLFTPEQEAQIQEFLK